MTSKMILSRPMNAPYFFNKQLKMFLMKPTLCFVLLFAAMQMIYGQQDSTSSIKKLKQPAPQSQNTEQNTQTPTGNNGVSSGNRIGKLVNQTVTTIEQVNKTAQQVRQTTNFLSELWNALKGLFGKKSAVTETQNSKVESQTTVQQLPKTTTPVQPQGTTEIIISKN